MDLYDEAFKLHEMIENDMRCDLDALLPPHGNFSPDQLGVDSMESFDSFDSHLAESAAISASWLDACAVAALSPSDGSATSLGDGAPSGGTEHHSPPGLAVSGIVTSSTGSSCTVTTDLDVIEGLFVNPQTGIPTILAPSIVSLPTLSSIVGSLTSHQLATTATPTTSSVASVTSTAANTIKLPLFKQQQKTSELLASELKVKPNTSASGATMSFTIVNATSDSTTQRLTLTPHAPLNIQIIPTATPVSSSLPVVSSGAGHQQQQQSASQRSNNAGGIKVLTGNSAASKKTLSRVDLNGLAEKKFPKPAYSYSCLIAMALKNSRTGSLPVNEIYNFMTENFPYFKTAPNGWKNSVRHNLSLNKCFEKIEKPSAQNGTQRKGCLWAMNPQKVTKMDEEVQKWSKKDPSAIRRSMANPERLELLEKGFLKDLYGVGRGDGGSEDDDDEEDDVVCDDEDGEIEVKVEADDLDLEEEAEIEESVKRAAAAAQEQENQKRLPLANSGVGSGSGSGGGRLTLYFSGGMGETNENRPVATVGDVTVSSSRIKREPSSDLWDRWEELQRPEVAKQRRLASAVSTSNVDPLNNNSNSSNSSPPSSPLLCGGSFSSSPQLKTELASVR